MNTHTGTYTLHLPSINNPVISGVSELLACKIYSPEFPNVYFVCEYCHYRSFCKWKETAN